MKPEEIHHRAWRSMQARDFRFGDGILTRYAAAGLPEGLRAQAASANQVAEILLYDEIGYFGVTAKDFLLALAKIPAGDDLRIRINSPGGDVFDGLAIYNAICARVGLTTCVVDGVAASAASFIACAGATLAMAEQSMLMIHNAWGVVCGDKRDMVAMAEVMTKIDGQIAAIYSAKSGKPATDFAPLMDAETWLTAQEAADAGLCDAVVAPPRNSAQTQLSASAATELRRRRLRVAEAVSSL